MNKKILALTLLLAVWPYWSGAEETSLQDQIDAVREEIREQEEWQQQLRDELTEKDEKITALKQRLEELEEKAGP